MKDYRKAVEALRKPVTLDDIAKAAGSSRASIKQCLLPNAAQSYRTPPSNLAGALIVLADQRAKYYAQLAADLRKGKA